MKTKFILLCNIFAFLFFSDCDFGIGEFPDDNNSRGYNDYSWGGGCLDFQLPDPSELWNNHYFSVIDSVGEITGSSAILYITIFSDETEKSDTTIFIQYIGAFLQTCNTGDIYKVCLEDYSKPLDSCNQYADYKCPLDSFIYSYEDRVYFDQFYYDFETPVFCLEPQDPPDVQWTETNYSSLVLTKDASINLCLNINGLVPNQKYVASISTEASISTDSTSYGQMISGGGNNKIEFRSAR